MIIDFENYSAYFNVDDNSTVEFEDVFLNFEEYLLKLKFTENANYQNKKNVLKELFTNLFKSFTKINLNPDQLSILLFITEKLLFASFKNNYEFEKAYSFFKKEIFVFSCDRLCFYSKKKFSKNELMEIFNVFYKFFFSQYNIYSHIFGFEVNYIFELENYQRDCQWFYKHLNFDEDFDKENKNYNVEEEYIKKEKLIEDILKKEKKVLELILKNENE